MLDLSRNDIHSYVMMSGKFSCVISKGRDVECGNMTVVHSAIFRDRNHGCTRG